MARRASGGRTIRVPGVHAAVRAHLVAFARQWESAPTLRDVDALDAYDLAVTGETVWRAMFDPLYPAEGDRFLGDHSHYWVSGPDALESIDERGQ